MYTRHGGFEIELYSWLRQPHKFLARKIGRWSVRFTTHVVCVSQAVAESVHPVLPTTRYSVIANWISGQKPLRPSLADLSSRARVLCTSRLEHYKGIHLLIEAARRLPQVEVTIAGDGSARASLEKDRARRSQRALCRFSAQISMNSMNARISSSCLLWAPKDFR